MFNIGISEMAIIAALALILIGPKQLPEMARTLGRLLNELRRSAGSFTEDLKKQVNIDHQKIFNADYLKKEDVKKDKIASEIETQSVVSASEPGATDKDKA